MPPCGQCNSGTAETASVLYLTHPVLSRPFLRFLKNFPAAACGRQTLNAPREVARQGRRGSDGSPVRTFGWVPPAGSFLSRQEAPQECGSRGAVGKADELRFDCHWQSFIRFAARRTAPLKNLPGLRRDEVGARALPARKMRLSGRYETA